MLRISYGPPERLAGMHLKYHQKGETCRSAQKSNWTLVQLSWAMVPCIRHSAQPNVDTNSMLRVPHPMQVHTRKLKLGPDVTDDVLRQVARDLPGLSGQAMAIPALLMCQASATV